MNPTEEQGRVLDANGRVVQINARAGTGKTSTLLMLAKKYHSKRILYLVYNKKTSEEAKNKFPSNTRVSTIHALAFKREGHKWKDNLGNFVPADMLPGFGDEGQILAQIGHSFLTYFLNTPFDKFEDAVPGFFEGLPKRLGDIFERQTAQIIDECKKMVTKWNSMEAPCPHDFYLKMFHRSKDFYTELAHYDMVMVDEGQDLSPIMLDSLKHYKNRVIIVGDSHQQIYSFRYAIDAMTKLTYDDAIELTLSFRFGEPIAAIATGFIQEAKKLRQFRIQGNPQKSSSVSLYSGTITENGRKTAILTRTNVALFDNAMALREAKGRFYFEKDLSSLFWRSLDIYWLFKMQHSRIRDPFIKTFKAYEHLKHYINTMDDFQLQGLCQIVEKYTSAFPSVIYEMLKFANDDNNPKEGIVLSTIHSAKGQEYERVYIDADVAERLRRVSEKPNDANDAKKNQLTEALIEEANITYVGFTRAKDELFLPSNFETILTTQWKNLLASLPKVPETVTETNEPSSERHRKGEYQIGDRVASVFDCGTIIEISDKKCLIALDNQRAQVWENLSNIRRLKKGR